MSIERLNERVEKIETVLQQEIMKAEKRAERAESLLVALTKEVNEQRDNNNNNKTVVDASASLEAIVKSSSNNTEEENQQENEEDEDRQQQQDSSDDESVVDGGKNKKTTKWAVMFQQLRKYRIINGNCKVPQKYAENKKLGRWVNFQREMYNNTKGSGKGREKIKPEKIIKLDSLGFLWGKKFPPPASWEDMFEQLQTFQQRMGNCNVPFNSTNITPLTKWAAYQRTEYRRLKKGHDSLLTSDQIGRLTDIGMNWKGPRL